VWVGDALGMACFGPGDDVFAELDTLKAWMLQSYVAMAPKRLGKLVAGGAVGGRRASRGSVFLDDQDGRLSCHSPIAQFLLGGRSHELNTPQV